MKHLLFTTICFLAFSVSVSAQTSETFDIATFQAPKGWEKQTKPGVMMFVTANEQKGTYAIITVYESGTSTGNAKSDFDADWQEFIAGQLGIKGKPEIEPVEKKDGWDVISGGAAFENETGPAAVILSTYSGFGKSFSAAAILNSEDNLPAIEAFAASIKLKKTAIASQPTPVNNDNASVLGSWLSSESDNSNYRVMNGVMSTIFRQYTFNANGTYSFVSKAYDPLMKSTLLGLESGTYQVSGSSITINPKKSILEEWSKKDGNDEWDKLLKTQNIRLEKVTYQFTKQYDALERLQIVLHTTIDTFRDGSPSSSDISNFAWYYPAVASPGNPAIKLPR